jgi:hypothetical protein
MTAVIHPVTVKEMQYMDIMKDPTLGSFWKRGFGSEVRRLFQVIRDMHETNTCFVVELENITKGHEITYEKIVCDYKPHKNENERVILTVGVDILNYSLEVATSTADIAHLKLSSTTFSPQRMQK